MLTVSGRSSPFLSVEESSSCDIVYVYRVNLSQPSACVIRHPAPRSGDRTGVAIKDPEQTTTDEYPGVLEYEFWQLQLQE
jgi:hypothetical protein